MTVTRWKPDTCPCVIDYEWDAQVPASRRVHTWFETIRACPAHTEVGPAHYAAVLADNKRKNTCQGIAKEVTFRDDFPEIIWTWTAERRLDVRFPDLNDADRILVQDAVNLRFGPDKVEVERPIEMRLTNISLAPRGVGAMALFMSHAPTGLAGYTMDIAIRNPLICRITDVAFPAEFPLNTHIPDPVSGQTVQISAVDISNVIIPGDTRILLAAVDIEGLAVGTTEIGVIITRLDDDSGNPLQALRFIGTVTVA